MDPVELSTLLRVTQNTYQIVDELVTLYAIHEDQLIPPVQQLLHDMVDFLKANSRHGLCQHDAERELTIDDFSETEIKVLELYSTKLSYTKIAEILGYHPCYIFEVNAQIRQKFGLSCSGHGPRATRQEIAIRFRALNSQTK